MRTSELSAGELNRILSLLLGRESGTDFEPANDHACAAALFDREDVGTMPMAARGRNWCAIAVNRDGDRSENKGTWQEGPTMLIAGCRATVAKFMGVEFSEDELLRRARQRPAKRG
ncbi:hypothetical protein J2W32_006532 [Variovorax boronicumulans]|uniref:DUF2591 domain-containing protein n=1 Tax=Variovorax boronicumulans TaxID=436515 RepID=A0AAW8D187_9BURK|nr:hypothetical protein [Variovorax boronicumulans]MDP9897403.1 hypothetical protein [Variovorax boronicumulans]MDQ0057455.1 hypothetical protein [Variovorax boronicumulans]